MRTRRSKHRLFTLPPQVLCWLILLASSSTDSAYAQIRAGSAFLKILPGTRQQNMVGSLTAGLDETYSIYANPGATGFLREWQLATSFNKWIADIYSVSLFAGKRFRLRSPVSDQVNLAWGLNFQGVGDFDATGGTESAVSAQDLLVTLSFGMPLSAFSRRLSLGGSVKYLRSELADFRAGTFAFDTGLLYRTPRIPIRFLLFEDLIISGGVAVSQLGNAVKFIAEETPLPRTFRAGLGLNLGKHDGLQVQLTGDYQKVRDESGRFNIGAELLNLFSSFSDSWGRALAVRGGYTFSDNLDTRLLSRYSLGLSLRFDDYMNGAAESRKHTLLPTNAALRIDAGALTSSTFSNTSQGSLTLRPIGPESFEFWDSDFYAFTAQDTSSRLYSPSDTIRLAWLASGDPDLYDSVNYLVLLIREDRTALEQLVRKSKQHDFDLFQLTGITARAPSRNSAGVDLVYYQPRKFTAKNGLSNTDPDAFLQLHATQDSVFTDGQDIFDFPLSLEEPLTAGNYYWTVVAYDANKHLRYASRDRSHVAQFRVAGHIAKADLQIHITKVVRPIRSARKSFVLRDINFDVSKSDLADLSSASWDSLDALVQRIKRDYPNTSIEIVGHTDPTGPESGTNPVAFRRSFNQRLSQRRAESIRDYFIQQGFESDSVKAVGYGETRLLPRRLHEPDSDWWQRCRRVEVVVKQDRLDTQNFAKITFSNLGETWAEAVSLSVLKFREMQPVLLQDLLTSTAPIIASIPREDDEEQRVLIDTTIANVAPGMETSFEVPVDAEEWPDLLALIDTANDIEEVDELNNRSWDRTILSHDLDLQQSVSDFMVQSGDTVTYRLTVTNRGPGSASAVTLTNFLPDVIEVIPRSFGAAAGLGITGHYFEPDNKIVWNIPHVPVGTDIPIRFKAQVNNLGADRTVAIFNRSKITSAGDVDQTNNESSTTIHSNLSNFGFKSVQLTPAATPGLKTLANTLKNLIADNPDAVFEIRGHASFEPNIAEERVMQNCRANLRYSKRRAGAVKKVLVELGVPEDRLISVGYGHFMPRGISGPGLVQPRQHNVTASARQTNRRVEIKPYSGPSQVTLSCTAVTLRDIGAADIRSSYSFPYGLRVGRVGELVDVITAEQDRPTGEEGSRREQEGSESVITLSVPVLMDSLLVELSKIKSSAEHLLQVPKSQTPLDPAEVRRFIDLVAVELNSINRLTGSPTTPFVLDELERARVARQIDSIEVTLREALSIPYRPEETDLVFASFSAHFDSLVIFLTDFPTSPRPTATPVSDQLGSIEIRYFAERLYTELTKNAVDTPSPQSSRLITQLLDSLNYELNKLRSLERFAREGQVGPLELAHVLEVLQEIEDQLNALSPIEQLSLDSKMPTPSQLEIGVPLDSLKRELRKLKQHLGELSSSERLEWASINVSQFVDLISAELDKLKSAETNHLGDQLRVLNALKIDRHSEVIVRELRRLRHSGLSEVPPSGAGQSSLETALDSLTAELRTLRVLEILVRDPDWQQMTGAQKDRVVTGLTEKLIKLKKIKPLSGDLAGMIHFDPIGIETDVDTLVARLRELTMLGLPEFGVARPLEVHPVVDRINDELEKLRDIETAAVRAYWLAQLKSLRISALVDSLLSAFSRLDRLNVTDGLSPEIRHLGEIFEALSLEVAKLRKVDQLPDRLPLDSVDLEQLVGSVTPQLDKLHVVQSALSDSFGILGTGESLRISAFVDSLTQELHGLRPLHFAGPGPPSEIRSVQNYTDLLSKELDRLSSLDLLTDIVTATSPELVDVSEILPDLILRLVRAEVKEFGDETVLFIQATARNSTQETMRHTTVRLASRESADGRTTDGSSEGTGEPETENSNRSRTGDDGRRVVTFASIKNLGTSWLPVRRLRIESTTDADGSAPVAADTVEITLPELAPGEEAPVQLKLRVPRIPGRPGPSRPDPTVIRNQNATIIVPGDTTVIVRYDTVFVGRDTTIVVRRDTVIVHAAEAGTAAIVKMRPDTTVIGQRVADVAAVTGTSDTTWLWLLLPLLVLAGAASVPLFKQLTKQRKSENKVVTWFTFYDVKARKKVLSEVVGKTHYDREGRTTYAVKGKTEDGRDLTKFVSKEHFDKVQMQERDSKQTRLTKKRPLGRVNKLRERLKGFAPWTRAD